MSDRFANTVEGNRQYHRSLARSLIEGLELDEALELCLAHGWDGIAATLLRQRDRPSMG